MEYVLRLEILEDLPDVDTIFVPVGGGGLISGIAVYVKAIKPSVKVLKITKQFLVFLLFLFGLQKHTLIVYLAHPFLKNISQIYTTLRQINEQRRNILCKVSTRNSLPPPFSPKESLLPLTPHPPSHIQFPRNSICYKINLDNSCNLLADNWLSARKIMRYVRVFQSWRNT